MHAAPAAPAVIIRSINDLTASELGRGRKARNHHGIREGDRALDSRNDYGYGPSNIMDDVSARDGSTSFGWNMFLFAVAVAMIAVNWGFLRPASRQLQQMRTHISALENSVAQLTQQHGAARQAASLLDLLAEQGRRSQQAGASLAQIRQLNEQLVAETSRLREASSVIDRLSSLRQQVSRQSLLIDETRAALRETVQLQQQLLLVPS